MFSNVPLRFVHVAKPSGASKGVKLKNSSLRLFVCVLQQSLANHQLWSEEAQMWPPALHFHSAPRIRAHAWLALAPAKMQAYRDEFVLFVVFALRTTSWQFTWWQACWELTQEAAARKGGYISTFPHATTWSSAQHSQPQDLHAAYISPERFKCWGTVGETQSRDWPIGSQNIDIRVLIYGWTPKQKKKNYVKWCHILCHLEARPRAKCEWGQSKTPRLVQRATLMFKYLVMLDV